MQVDEDLVTKFKEAFKKDYGLVLGENEVKESVENLVKFFSLLFQWDREDQEKAMKMKG